MKTDSEKLALAIRAMKQAIELIRNASFIAAWQGLKMVLKELETNK